MNIFITDYNPIVAAEYLIEVSPRRARKIAVECSQILSEACRLGFGFDDVPHGFQGNKTPLFWVMQSEYNLWWTYHYMRRLASEYDIRCRKVGKFKDKELWAIWYNILVQELGLTPYGDWYCDRHFKPMCLCQESSKICFDLGDVHQSYRKLLERKVRDE